MPSLKRKPSSDPPVGKNAPRTHHRVKPTLAATTPTPLCVKNVEDGETIHQQSLLLIGLCPVLNASDSDADVIEVHAIDSVQISESTQKWPVHNGKWKAIVLLSPGGNTITIRHYHKGALSGSASLTLVHIPLVQLPPLHLAIMVAKNSTHTIDKLASSRTNPASSPSDMDDVIAKFRVTAYMWQAIIAEEMRRSGLGRRSFRLEEVNSPDSITLDATSGNRFMLRALPKVHVVLSDKNLTTLRKPMYAQDNHKAKDAHGLYDIFTSALRSAGAPFDPASHPVVAGLIMDSHYDEEKKFVVAHAMIGRHDRDGRNGVSLGMFGSHLAHSWPRLMDDIPSCLVDTTNLDDTVRRDEPFYNTMGKACCFGQGTFLKQIGKALGAEWSNKTYTDSWPDAFLGPISSHEHEEQWTLKDRLRFRASPLFRLPHEAVSVQDLLTATLDVDIVLDENDDDVLKISSAAQLAIVKVTSGNTDTISFDFRKDEPRSQITITNLTTYDRSQPLLIYALAMNGEEKNVTNGWRLPNIASVIKIPGSDVCLRKRSVVLNGNFSNKAYTSSLERDQNEYHSWTVLLKKRSEKDGSIIAANKINLHMGHDLDGAVVYYPDGTQANCCQVVRGGARWAPGGVVYEHDVPSGAKIAKVQIGRRSGRNYCGLKMTLSTGVSWGLLTHAVGEFEVLEPGPGEEIVGFYGTNQKYYVAEEFGIVLAPKGVELPDAVWDMPELQNPFP